MKISKILGLAVIAALALTAWAGAGTAIAGSTVLCKSSAELPYCPSADRYPMETTFSSTSSEVGIQAGASSVVCSESSLNGKLLLETNSPTYGPLWTTVSSWTLGGCKDATSSPCTATPTGTSGGSFYWSEHTLKIGNGTKRGWAISCPSTGLSCTMKFEPTTSVNGGSPAHILAVSQPMSKTGTSCPSSTPMFTADYTVSSPKPFYVARTDHPITVFCKGEEAPCQASNIYPEGTVFKAVNTAAYLDKITISTTENTIRCNSVMEGKIGANVGEGQSLSITKWTLGENNGKSEYCNSTKNPYCSGPNGEGLPYQGMAKWPNSGIAIEAAKWYFNCGFGGLNCTYKGNTSLGGYGLPGTGLDFELFNTFEHVELGGGTQNLTQSGSLCFGSSPTIKGDYEVVQPATSMYVSWK